MLETFFVNVLTSFANSERVLPAEEIFLPLPCVRVGASGPTSSAWRWSSYPTPGFPKHSASEKLRVVLREFGSPPQNSDFQRARAPARFTLEHPHAHTIRFFMAARANVAYDRLLSVVLHVLATCSFRGDTVVRKQLARVAEMRDGA